MVLLRYCLTGVLLFLSASCTRLHVNPPLPPPAEVAEVASSDDGTPFAVSPDGSRVAFVRNGLLLLRVEGKESGLSNQIPSTLSWSPDGSTLATASRSGDESDVVLFDRGGAVRRRQHLPAVVASIGWSDGTLLAYALKLERYGFGVNVKGMLYRIAPEAPEPETLYDVTLRPTTLKRWEAQIVQLPMAVSPLGDEIVYVRPNDPPALETRFVLLQRHLVTGVEREVPLEGFPAEAWYAGGDDIIVDAVWAIRRIGLWNGINTVVSGPGRHVAVSPAGSTLLVDGRLTIGGKQVAQFPPRTEGIFGGNHLLIRNGGRLYLVKGLPPEPDLLPGPALRPQLLKLRQWRTQELITNEEYRQNTERLLHP